MVRMKNVSNQYGKKTVLRNANLSIGQGEFWVLFGADDAGKTTLLHLLMGDNCSYLGKVLLMGCPPNWLEQHQRELVRYVPDDLLWEEGVTGAEYLQRAERVTSRYNRNLQQKLCGYFHVPVNQELLQMSHQNNKLIQIIAAMAAEPKLLLLDEPMNFLEEDVWTKVLSSISIYQKQQGMAVLITALEYEELKGKCDHYAYLRDGRLITGEARRDTGCARLVTAVRNNTRETGIYRGSAEKIQNLLVKAGYQDWIIEQLTLREELDMAYESKN